MFVNPEKYLCQGISSCDSGTAGKFETEGPWAFPTPVGIRAQQLWPQGSRAQGAFPTLAKAPVCSSVFPPTASLESSGSQPQGDHASLGVFSQSLETSLFVTTGVVWRILLNLLRHETQPSRKRITWPQRAVVLWGGGLYQALWASQGPWLLLSKCQ